MLWKKCSESLLRPILKIAERKSGQELTIRRFLFFLFSDGSTSAIRSSSNVLEKTDFSREYYHLSWRGLHRQCADYRFEPLARQVIKSQDPAALLVAFCLHFSHPPRRRRAARSSGEKTPLTKVNSHDPSLFAGARKTPIRNFIHELL